MASLHSLWVTEDISITVLKVRNKKSVKRGDGPLMNCEARGQIIIWTKTIWTSVFSFMLLRFYAVVKNGAQKTGIELRMEKENKMVTKPYLSSPVFSRSCVPLFCRLYATSSTPWTGQVFFTVVKDVKRLFLIDRMKNCLANSQLKCWRACLISVMIG